MMLNSVDLPQPDGPITATNSPSRTSMLVAARASTVPVAVTNRFATFSTLRIGALTAFRHVLAGSK